MRFPSPGAIRAGLGVAVVGVLLTVRLPFMAPSVDDLDSTNFHAGIVDYSPPHHRPHPPGFPVFILAAKAVTAGTDSPLVALTLLSAVAGSLACIPLFVIGCRLFGAYAAVCAGVVLAFTPIVWFASVRPMSDATGLLAGLTALALLLSGLDRKRPYADLLWSLGILAAGIAMGVRLQLSVLVLPLAAFGWLVRRRMLLLSPVLMAGAVSAWWFPMVALSGGFDAYATAFRATMAEAASWEPLLSQPSIERALTGLRSVTVAPWGAEHLALPVLAVAAVGLVRTWRRDATALRLLLLMFLPYSLFNYLIQNTTAVRYVIPAIPMTALLVGAALAWARGRSRIVTGAAVVAYVAVASASTVPALREYRRQPAPALRAMQSVPRDASGHATLSGSGVFDRFLKFAPSGVHVISAAGGDGWRRVTDRWRRGETSPVYYLLTSGESLLGLLQADAYREAFTWRWSPRILSLMDGERPNVVRLARLDPPTWFLHRLSMQPFTRRADAGLFVRADDGGYNVLIQGRSETRVTQTFAVRVDGVVQNRQAAQRTFALQAAVNGNTRYSEVAIDAESAVTLTRVVAVRPTRAAFQPLAGWRRATESDRDFHWLDRTAAIMVHVPPRGATLRLAGRVPEEWLSSPATLTAHWGGTAIASTILSEPSFAMAISLPPAQDPWSPLILATLAGFAPEVPVVQLDSISIDTPWGTVTHATPPAVPSR